jgi:hypothetical protein
MFHTVQGRFALAVEREDLDAAERLFDKLEYVREQLGAPAASMVERLLIDRVALCLGRLWYVEDVVSATYGRGVSIDEAQHWDKRLTTAQNRFLKACVALDRHRLLMGGSPRTPVYDAVGYAVSEPRQITGE